MDAGHMNAKSSSVVPGVADPASQRERKVADVFAVLSISIMMIDPDVPSRFTAVALVDVSVTVNRTEPIGLPCFAVTAVAITSSSS